MAAEKKSKKPTEQVSRRAVSAKFCSTCSRTILICSARRSAAAADDVHAEIFGEMDNLFCKSLRRFVIMLRAVFDFGQTGVRQNRHGNFGEFSHRYFKDSAICFGPVPQFIPITSIGNGSSAVSAAQISVPLSIVPKVSIVTCAMTGILTFRFWQKIQKSRQSRFRLQKILTGFDDKQINPPSYKPAHLLIISLFQIPKRNMPERRQFRSRSDRTGDKTRLCFGRIIIGDMLRHLRRFEIHIVSFFDNPEFRQNDFRTAESIRFNHIAARFEKIAMNNLNRVRRRVNQILRTILKIRAAEIFQRQAPATANCVPIAPSKTTIFSFNKSRNFISIFL